MTNCTLCSKQRGAQRARWAVLRAFAKRVWITPEQGGPQYKVWHPRSFALRFCNSGWPSMLIPRRALRPFLDVDQTWHLPTFGCCPLRVVNCSVTEMAAWSCWTATETHWCWTSTVASSAKLRTEAEVSDSTAREKIPMSRFMPKQASASPWGTPRVTWKDRPRP